MKFTIRKASYGALDLPEANLPFIPGYYIIKIGSLEELMELARKEGELIISTDLFLDGFDGSITIYDDWIE